MTEYGRLHLLYGDGEGKTTCAAGKAVRAAGAGLSVGFVQFMKSGDSSEVPVLKQTPGIMYYDLGEHQFMAPDQKPTRRQVAHAKLGLYYATESLRNGMSMVVCDEILTAVLYGLVRPEEVMELVEDGKGRTELVLTGLRLPGGYEEELFELATYATEFKKVKHGYSRLKARRGIEY